MIHILQIILLGFVQGAAELLPISSSAHVIVAEKLMGLDPSAPDMTFLLVMLHTGTMLAVLVYFWRSWKQHYFSSTRKLTHVAINVITATVITVVLGLTERWLHARIATRSARARKGRYDHACPNFLCSVRATCPSLRMRCRAA